MEVIPEPPGLPYSLRQHKLSISIIWTLLAIDITVLPITLYFSLAFATHLKSAYIFAITTSVFGLISGIEWAFRSWHLWRWPRVRPLHDASSPDILDQERTGSEAEEGNELKDDEKKNRWHFDFFHWTYTTGYAVALIELIVGAAPHQPFIRVCSLPAPSFVLLFGIVFSFFSFADALHLCNPIRISSQPKGSRARPATYWVLEDVVAVDTGVGRNWRLQVARRWEASSVFRRLLRQLGWFWGVAAILVGVGCFAAVLHPKVDKYVAYGIGWGVPPVWAIVWALITTRWVQLMLEKERVLWRKSDELSHDFEKAANSTGG